MVTTTLASASANGLDNRLYAQEKWYTSIDNKYATGYLGGRLPPDVDAGWAIELLGGMRIRVGSDVWDSSVRNRLHRLQQQL